MSELRRNLQINGETFQLAVSQYGDSSPQSTTPGKPGVLYLNTFNGNLYKCTAADPENGNYTWVAMVGGGSIFATTVRGEGAEEISVMTLRISKPNTGYVLSIGDKLITADNYLYEVTALPETATGGYAAKLIRNLNASGNGEIPGTSLRITSDGEGNVIIKGGDPQGSGGSSEPDLVITVQVGANTTLRSDTWTADKFSVDVDYEAVKAKLLNRENVSVLLKQDYYYNNTRYTGVSSPFQVVYDSYHNTIDAEFILGAVPGVASNSKNWVCLRIASTGISHVSVHEA